METRYHTQSSPGGTRAAELEFQMLRHSPGPPPRPVDGLALKPLCHCPADSKPSGSTLAPAARGHVDAPGQPCSPESARRQDGCELGLSVHHPLGPRALRAAQALLSHRHLQAPSWLARTCQAAEGDVRVSALARRQCYCEKLTRLSPCSLWSVSHTSEAHQPGSLHQMWRCRYAGPVVTGVPDILSLTTTAPQGAAGVVKTTAHGSCDYGLS